MKNTMKRIISLAMAALLLISTLAFVGCGTSKMTCEICELEKNSKTHKITVNGEEKFVCSDCNKLQENITPDAPVEEDSTEA